MSRGFVKEPDELPEPVLRDERRERQMTRSGLAALEARLAVSTDAAERKTLALRVAGAVVPAAPADMSVAAFGARIVVTEAGRGERNFTLVGEDEIDIEAGRIGIDSPLARALLGARAGERVTWHRPSGDARLIVRSIDYDA